MRESVKESLGPRGWLSGPACLIDGYRMLARPRLRKFLLLPLLGNLLLFTLATVLTAWLIDAAVAAWIPAGWSWLSWVLLPLAFVGLVLAFLFGFTLLANLLLGPFLGNLSAAVREELGHPPLSAPRIGWWAAARQELRRLAYVGLCLVGVLVLGWIPLVQFLAAPLGVAVSAWLLVLEFSAHPLGLREYTLGDQLGMLRRQRASAIGFGLAALGLLMVPLLNLLLVPAAVVGATLWVEQRIQP